MWSISRVLIAAALLRFVMIGIAAVQDRLADVKYTDVDYQVYSDAARSLHLGMSPYFGRTELLRNDATKYRYSPIVAHLLIPNVICFAEWGKLLFSIADLFCGYVIFLLVRHMFSVVSVQTSGDEEVFCSDNDISKELASFCAAAFLFNPFVFTLSTRGSFDSLTTLVLLVFMYFFVRSQSANSEKLSTESAHEAVAKTNVDARTSTERWIHFLVSAVLFGLSGHLRIYPIIFVVPLFFAIPRFCEYIIFGITSFLTFAAITGYYYILYGQDFLNEVYFHHLSTRVDSQHNFSIWFYPFWLCQENLASRQIPAASAAEPALTSISDYSEENSHTFNEDQTMCFAVVKLAASVLQIGGVMSAGCLMWGLSSLDDNFKKFNASLITSCSAFLNAKSVCYVARNQSWLLAPWFLRAVTIQTILFVGLNRVITAQYFLWIWQFLPLILPVLLTSWTGVEVIKACVLWMLSEVFWLLWAYFLEFRQQSWARPVTAVASVLFLGANLNLCWLIANAVPREAECLAVKEQQMKKND